MSLNCLLACQQLYAEESKVLYGANTFIFWEPSALEKFASELPAKHQNWVKDIHIGDMMQQPGSGNWRYPFVDYSSLRTLSPLKTLSFFYIWPLHAWKMEKSGDDEEDARRALEYLEGFSYLRSKKVKAEIAECWEGGCFAGPTVAQAGKVLKQQLEGKFPNVQVLEVTGPGSRRPM